MANMASLSELRAQQQERQQARRPASSTSPTPAASAANIYESTEATSPRRTAAHRHRRHSSISTLRVTNPDVDESTANPRTWETSTEPDVNGRTANWDIYNNLPQFGRLGTVNSSEDEPPEIHSDLSGLHLTNSPDAPNGLLEPRAYEAPVRACPGFTPALHSPTLGLSEPDPFSRNYSAAAIARKPRAQTENIRSFVSSTLRKRDPIYPVTYTVKFARMATGAKVPQPGPARIAQGGGPDEWLEAAKQCKYLPEAHMKQLCETVKEFLMEESNIQPVKTPVTVCGDIHGQFYDLLELFRVAGGMPNDTNVEGPTVPTKVITSEDIEPPSTITDPKLKKRFKDSSGESAGSSEVSTDVSDEDEEERGRSRGIEDDLGMNKGGSQAGFTASGDQGFIFLGDFVDRGYFSLETFTLLMCLKAKFPDRITLIRGNHESRQITQVYGFYEECQSKYGNASVWKACCQVFDFLPLAAVVDGKVLCVHGGLSPEIRTLDQVRVVARAQEIPHEGAFCDLVWSDPEDVDTWAVSPRGAGWLFGDKVATEFNHVNGLSLIARAHQLVNEGFKYHFKAKDVVTVWSAPNYCYRCGNVASIMNLAEDMNPKFAIFSAVPDDQRAVPATTNRRTEYFL